MRLNTPLQCRHGVAGLQGCSVAESHTACPRQLSPSVSSVTREGRGQSLKWHDDSWAMHLRDEHDRASFGASIFTSTNTYSTHTPGLGRPTLTPPPLSIITRPSRRFPNVQWKRQFLCQRASRNSIGDHRASFRWLRTGVWAPTLWNPCSECGGGRGLDSSCARSTVGGRAESVVDDSGTTSWRREGS